MEDWASRDSFSCLLEKKKAINALQGLGSPTASPKRALKSSHVVKQSLINVSQHSQMQEQDNFTYLQWLQFTSTSRVGVCYKRVEAFCAAV